MKKVLPKILISLTIFGLFCYYIFRNYEVIKQTFNTTASHLTGYMVLAIIGVLVGYYFLNKMYLKAFQMVNIRRTAFEMFSLQLQSLAINVVVPTGGVSAAMIFAGDAKKREESPALAVNGLFITFLADYAAIALMLILVLIYLSFIKSLTTSVSISATIFLLLTFGAYLLTFLAAKQTKWISRTMTTLANVFVVPIFKLFKKTPNVTEGVHTFVEELGSAYISIRKDPRDLTIAILLALLHHFMRLVTLYLIFASFGAYPAYRTLLAGYAIGALFVVVSPTPNGVGFVEGAMTIVFTRLGLPTALSATVTLIYRGLEFWIPFFIGFILLQRSRLRDIKKETIGLANKS
jgi:uncharacterized protein (TIRG00374 family)